MIEILHENIARAQTRYKQFVDAKRIERIFEIGDMVFLKIQAYNSTNSKTSEIAFKIFWAI